MYSELQARGAGQTDDQILVAVTCAQHKEFTPQAAVT